MLTKIYFCLFCPQKYETNDENALKKHLINVHFDGKHDPIVEQWIDSLILYQTELNECLSSDPKSLPKSSTCQTNDNTGGQSLLRGCGLCDRIIHCFKLNVNSVNKSRNVCICGEGRESNKVVVICHLCKHLYHYPCVEPTGYSGEELSLYKCFKCKPKDFEITDLSSETEIWQSIHVSHHFNYQPFVCKVVHNIDGQSVVCNETFFRQTFLKTHLKSEHNLRPNEKEFSNYCRIDCIPKVQKLIENSLKKLNHKINNQAIGQTSGQSSSFQKRKLSQEIADNQMTNKRIRTESVIQLHVSSDQRESGDHSVPSHEQYLSRPSTSRQNMGPMLSNSYRNNSSSQSPPILVNQSFFNEPNPINPIKTSQMPAKRGRGRPKGSKSKAVGKGTAKKQITPNRYIADGNPQLKSRLSLESRMSRPNISLSREQERELQNRNTKMNGNQSKDKKTANHKKNGDNGSDWDSDTELYETGRRSDHRVFESAVHQNTENQRLDSKSDNETDESIQMKRSAANTTFIPWKKTTPIKRKSPQKVDVLSSDSEESIIDLSNSRQEVSSAIDCCPVLEPTQEVNEQVTQEGPPLLVEEMPINIEENATDVEPTVDKRPVLVTEITRAEDSNHSMEMTPKNGSNSDINHKISTPNQELQIQEPVVNQSNGHSDWLTHTKPKKFPYFPQINDEVVYIPFGHRLYIDAVRKLRLYKQTNTSKYVGNEYINEILFAKVREIRFEKHSNIRLTRLVLTLIDSDIQTNRTFNVKFHDIDDVLDFIILKQNYNNSLMRNWKINDSFRAIIDEKWWFGEIHSFNVTENSFRTQFQALNIVWGNSTTDILSYWDLEPIIGELPQNTNISIDVTDEDRKLFYTSEVKEWPSNGKVEECKRIVNGLTQAMELTQYKELMEVFNTSNPEYIESVPYLINLSIIRSRVQNLFYRRHSAIKYEIKFLDTNASILDPSEATDLVTNARIVVAVCLKFIDDPRSNDVHNIYNKVMIDMSNDPRHLSKIKYYATSRPQLNPNPNIMNPLMAETCANILSTNGTASILTILTPSSTKPIVNQIRRSNESNISVIELTDSEEDVDENRSQNIEELVSGVEQFLVSPTAPDSPSLPPILESVEALPHTIPSSQTSKPVVSVGPQPIVERSPQQDSEPFLRYFCIFCSEKFFDRNQVIDHYFRELEVKLKCTQCPQNTAFESFEHFMSHNSEHIKQMKTSLNSKIYLNSKTWIESLIGYMDTLLDPIIAQREINPKFGDHCIVCQRINVLTPDSQPFFHKKFFANNRISMKSSLKPEVEFAQHMRYHLKYEPVYKCTLCVINTPNDVFSSPTIDDNCRQHLHAMHEIPLQSTHVSDVTSFFGNTKIANIDNIIPDAVNRFIFFSINW